MKKSLLLACFFVFLGTVASAEFEWPDHHSVVRINGEVIVATWRNGMPFASRQQTLHLLHVRTGPDEIDLAQILAEQGFKMSLNADGSIDCFKANSLKVRRTSPNYTHEASLGAPPSASSKHRSKGQSSSRTTNKSHDRSGHGARITTNSSSSAKSHDDGSRSGVDISVSQQQVQSIGSELAVQCRRPIDWVFTVVEESEPNAWTPGEGRVFVTTGLLRLQLTKDEIAGILGHEIAHGARQHLAQGQLQKAREQKADREARQAQARYAKAQAEYQHEMRNEQNQNPNSIGAVMAKDKLDWETRRAKGQMRQVKRQDDFNLSYREHETVFNHSHEREADSVGMGYCIAAGYRPDGLLTALQKIAAASYNNYGARALSGGRTHPPIGQRIERLQELLRQKGY